MRLKKYLILFILLFMLCSCTEGGNGLDVKISSPNKSFLELASTTYDESQLLNIIQFEGTINELNAQYPIECIRKVKGGYRVSYLGDLSVAVIFFDNVGSKILGRVYSMVRLKSEFSDLTKGQSIETVQKIDPTGEYLFLYSGRNDLPRISTHYTRDGSLITIEYDSSRMILDIKEELI